jgi:hypothetical protein
MPENRSELDWFHHFSQLTVTELRILIRQEAPTPTNEAQKALVGKHQALLENILESLSEEKADPASIFQKGLAALSEIDKERFLIENLLERVKQGYSLRDTVEKYHGLGLTDIDVSQIPSDGSKPLAGSEPPESSIGAGKFLQGIQQNLKKVAAKIIQLVINAMKAIPKFVGIKPSIGFSGPFPTFSLQFDLQTESLTVYELFQDLTKGL